MKAPYRIRVYQAYLAALTGAYPFLKLPKKLKPKWIKRTPGTGIRDLSLKITPAKQARLDKLAKYLRRSNGNAIDN